MIRFRSEKVYGMNLDHVLLPPFGEDYWIMLRSMTPSQKLRAANNLWCVARQTTRKILRDQHPEWTEGRLQWEVAREMSHGEVEQVPPEFRPAGWNEGVAGEV